MKKPAVFIDRDGTINEQMGYINHIDRFVLLQGTAEAIRLLNLHRYLVIIISNQSGVARGYFPMELLEKVHVHMKTLLEKEDAVVDGIYFCPHHPSGIIPDYRIACNCRKPGTGLIEKACKHFNIDLEKSWVIGDRCEDIELAHRSHLKGILVRTGYGLGEIDYVLPCTTFKPNHIAKNLLHAVRWIFSREEKIERL